MVADHIRLSQKKGRWGKVEQVPGTPALNKDDKVNARSVSCAPAGTCAADGDYSKYSESRRGLQHLQGFVIYDGTRTRRAHSAGPVSDILDHRALRPGRSPACSALSRPLNRMFCAGRSAKANQNSRPS